MWTFSLQFPNLLCMAHKHAGSWQAVNWLSFRMYHWAKRDSTGDHKFDLSALQPERTNKQNAICWSQWSFVWGIISHYLECLMLSIFFNDIMYSVNMLNVWSLCLWKNILHFSLSWMCTSMTEYKAGMNLYVPNARRLAGFVHKHRASF